jgi:hypothetical protein
MFDLFKNKIDFSSEKLTRNRNLNKGREWQIFLSLSAFAVFVLFWVSIDSYTHDLYGRGDESWYFMAGKAWMNGLIPYVDFTDSKGPLLWLIYGIGYLLSNYNYVGVFWIECLFYSITFFFCYKISCLFLPGKRLCIISAMLMSLVFFNGILHYEIRAEEFCQPFIAASMYFVLRLIYTEIQEMKKDVRKISFVLGISIAACLLIKFTVAIMLFVFVFVLLFYLFRFCRHLVFFSVWNMAVGFVVVCLPFVIYFISVGNFNAFIEEYFINTYQTVHIPFTEMLTRYIKNEWLGYFYHQPKIAFFFFLAFVGCFFFYRKLSSLKLLPLLFFGWFLALSLKHNYWDYYLTACFMFFIFPIIMIAGYFETVNVKRFWLPVGGVLIAALTFVIENVAERPNFVFNTHASEFRKDYYDMACVLSNYKNPKIMNIYQERGCSTPVDGLPANRYWSQQAGATKQMIEERLADLLANKADFIFIGEIFWEKEDYAQIDSLLVYAGYKLCYENKKICHNDKIYEKPVRLYSKVGLPVSLPPENFSVGVMDVLLKKRIFSRN